MNNHRKARFENTAISPEKDKKRSSQFWLFLQNWLYIIRNNNRKILMLSPDQAFSILPLRRQRVQILIRRVPPLILARTSNRLGRYSRTVLLFAWLTVLPSVRFFPHISH
jgi:hypothetical protein